MIRSIPATELKVGDVLALPMGRTAHIANVRVGTRFVNFKTDEYGQSRVERGSEVLIEAPTTDEES